MLNCKNMIGYLRAASFAKYDNNILCAWESSATLIVMVVRYSRPMQWSGIESTNWDKPLGCIQVTFTEERHLQMDKDVGRPVLRYWNLELIL
jgi:hypothetical protein